MGLRHRQVWEFILILEEVSLPYSMASQVCFSSPKYDEINRNLLQ